MKDLFEEITFETCTGKVTISDIIEEVANLTVLNDPEDETQKDINELLKATVEAVALKTIIVMSKRGFINIEKL